MGAVEETRKAIQDSLAPEIRTLAANIDALRADGLQTRAEIVASEGRLLRAIEQLRAELPLVVRNAVFEQQNLQLRQQVADLQKAQ